MRSRRKVQRLSYPFGTAEGALNQCAVKLSDNDEYHPDRTSFLIDQDASSRDGLHVKCRLQIDRGRILSQTGRDSNDVCIVIVLETPSYRRNTVCERWKLSETPEEFSLTIASEDYSESTFHLRVACSAITGAIAGTDPDGMPRHATITAKTFSFKAPASKSLFPVQNTSFSERGWDPDAMWYCEFQDLDAYAEGAPEDLLTVHLNKDLVGLQQLWAPSAARRPSRRTTASMVRSMIVGQVLSEIVLTVLRHHHQHSFVGLEPPDEEEGSLLHLVRTSLAKHVEVPFEELVQASWQDPGKVTLYVQAMTKMGRKFGMEALQSLDHAASELL